MRASGEKPEIMAPAGDWVCLRAAINAGCDSVYFGVEGFNMRAGARNFSAGDMAGVMDACHGEGRKGYLALNVLVHEGELGAVRSLLDETAMAGVDAVICSDMGIVSMAHRIGLPVFVSTQISVSNSGSIAFFYRTFGIKRFVLARECSLEDMVAIRAGLRAGLGAAADEIELEVFVHGAMCVSVSGRCFLSHYQYGKSANRGECLQPCRREYEIMNTEEGVSFKVGSDYVLSPRDLCALPFIEKLMEAEIDSFKIEGRNRSPEYVSVVTGAYRRAVDFYSDNHAKEGFEENFQALKKQLMEELGRVYNRGFSSGFYLGKPVDEWTQVDGSHAVVRKMYSGIVKNYYARPGVAEILIHDNEFQTGDEIIFQGATTGTVSQKVLSMEVDHKPVTRAVRGKLVAVKTDVTVRRNDKVFKVVEDGN